MLDLNAIRKHAERAGLLRQRWEASEYVPLYAAEMWREDLNAVIADINALLSEVERLREGVSEVQANRNVYTGVSVPLCPECDHPSSAHAPATFSALAESWRDNAPFGCSVFTSERQCECSRTRESAEPQPAVDDDAIRTFAKAAHLLNDTKKRADGRM